MSKIIKPLLIIAILAGGGFWIYQSFFADSTGSAGASGGFTAQMPGVVIAKAEMRQIADSVDAIGTLLADESVTLTAKVTDTVKAINFEDGDFVDKGAVLVELTNDEESAQLDEAEANLIDSRRQLERLETLGVNQQVSKSAIDEARAKAEANQAKYNAIVARLKDRLVVAPFDGVLGFRQISPGALVSTGTEITTIDDIHRVKADFSIPEKFFSQFKVGDTVRALSDAYPEELFFGEVTSIGSRVDPVTRSITVRARIENSDRRLRPGMLVKIRIFAQRLPKVLVPEAGVILDGEGAFVYIIESEESGPKAVARRIVIEKRIPGSVVVSSGVDEGETVVALGTMSLRSGTSVEILSETTIPPLPDAPRAVTSPDGVAPENSDAGSEGI